jgi:hypothetical protein
MDKRLDAQPYQAPALRQVVQTPELVITRISLRWVRNQIGTVCGGGTFSVSWMESVETEEPLEAARLRCSKAGSPLAGPGAR